MRIILCSSKDVPEVYVMSLDEIVSKLPVIAHYNIISIRDPNPGTNAQKYQKIDSFGLENLLAISFDDLWLLVHQKVGKLPQGSHVVQILDWAKRKWNENHKPFVVHCTAGISRSSAVAILLDAMFRNSDEAVDRYNTERHWPNSRILEIGEKYLQTPGLAEKVKNKQKENRASAEEQINPF